MDKGKGLIMELSQVKVSDKTKLELSSGRYMSQCNIDCMEDVLRRAQGLAGMLVESSILAQNPAAEIDIKPAHIEHTAKALELEIADALTFINALYYAPKGE